MSQPSKAGDGSLERLREEATDDQGNTQVHTDEDTAKTMKEAADDADSEQGIGAGIKSSGDQKN